jgi:hypothetical protein
MHAMMLLMALACGVGCQHVNHSGIPARDGSSMVTLQVHGMMKTKSGAT